MLDEYRHVAANGIPSELGVGPAHHRRYVIGVLIWKAVGKPIDDSLNGLIFISGRHAASFPAAGLSHKADELLPRAIGHGSLALALSAYEQWLESADASSAELIDAAMVDLVRTRELIAADSHRVSARALSARLNEAGAGVASSAWQ